MNKDIVLKDGKLYFGTHVVKNYECVEGKELCKYFAIRVFENGYYRLCTTLDIIDNYIWINGIGTSLYANGERVVLPSAYYDNWYSVERLLNTLAYETAGKDWIIVTDDDWLDCSNGDDYIDY